MEKISRRVYKCCFELTIIDEMFGRIAVLILVWSVAAAAQGMNTQNAPHFTVKGRVVNSQTGEPVRGAVVMLNGPEQHTGFSAEDGQFLLDGVPKGSMFISARRPGYADGAFNNRAQRIDVSDNVDSVVVKLAPEAKLSGTVQDSDGEPVEGLQVSCMQQVVVQGRKTWQRHQGAMTDEKGKFVLDNLAPGAYFIGTAQKPMYPGGNPNDEARRLLYGAQFYPNSPGIASAQPVEVKPGDNLQLDMTVATVRGARISFSTNPPAKSVWGELVNEDGQTISIGSPRNDKTGQFTIPSVPPGAWTLTVNEGGGRGGRDVASFGEASIAVGSSDVTSLVINVSDPLQIPVNISGGDAPAQPQQPGTGASVSGTGRMSHTTGTSSQGANSLGANAPPLAFVRLAPASTAASTSMNRMNAFMNGLTLQNVMPGKYRVIVQAFGQNCVDTVTSGALDLTRNNLVVTAGAAPAPINVNLQSNCAELDVAFNQKTDGTVIVVGDSQAQDPLVMPVSGGNPLTAPRLSPGEYVVYAFSDVTGLEYASPEAMRNYSGQHVTLAAGQKTSLTLDIVDREQR